MNEPFPRITLRHIAERAGVSTMTVSLALRNRPELPRSTRERIQALAAEMGYRPDPALAALNRYRANMQSTPHGVTIAYLTAFETRNGWRKGFLQRTFEGASQRAEQLGYRLEHFWVREPGLTPCRLANILENRGIRGVLAAPLPHPGSLEFPWERFSAVAIGPSLIEPALHSACNNHYQSMLLALKHLSEAGYQRIGLILDPEVDRRHQQKYMAAFTIFQQQTLPGKSRLPPLLISKPSVESIRHWLWEHSPEAVLCHDDAGIEWLRQAGADVPGKMGFASLIRGGSEEITGIETFPEKTAAAAVNRLNQLLQDNEIGVPELPASLMLSGSWVTGRTLPVHE